MVKSSTCSYWTGESLNREEEKKVYDVSLKVRFHRGINKQAVTLPATIKVFTSHFGKKNNNNNTTMTATYLKIPYCCEKKNSFDLCIIYFLFVLH